MTRDGSPVTNLQPYLGAYGHLVALRDGDLAYLHVHPMGEPGDGAPRRARRSRSTPRPRRAGSYRLYFDFQVDGRSAPPNSPSTAGDRRRSSPTPTTGH